MTSPVARPALSPCRVVRARATSLAPYAARVRLARLSAPLGVSLALFATNVAMAYEEPAFEVVGTHDGFELRKRPAIPS